MYIKKEVFHYLEFLYNTLDDYKKQKFLSTLKKTLNKRLDLNKVQVVTDEIFNSKGISSGEFLTKTAIIKAYKSAKQQEENKKKP